jgi:trimeric autotransporter adhesin
MSRVAILVALAALASYPTLAQQTETSTTRLVPFAGVLPSASSGPQAVTFSLFDGAEGGALLWTETQHVTADAGGRYAVYLGAATPLPLDIFRSEQARWLEVMIAGRALPRSMLVAVPYALKAADAETLAGTPLSSFVVAGENGRLRRADGAALSAPVVEGTGVQNQLPKWTGTETLGNSIVTESAAGQLGIGTTDPTEGGWFNSSMTIRTADGTSGLSVANQAGTPRFALNVNADGSWVTFDRATGTWQPGVAQFAGRVGIGITDPSAGGAVDAKFTVRQIDNKTAIALLNQADAKRLAINTLPSGGWVMYDGVGDTWNPGLRQENGRIILNGIFADARLRINAASSISESTLEGIHVISGTAHAVRARSANNAAVLGMSSQINSDFITGTNIGVHGVASGADSAGVRGDSDSGHGVMARTTSNEVGAAALYAVSASAAPAGRFDGDVNISGTLTKGGGSFRIDHPLDPANKYLSHSFVESPDMMNVYNGNVVLDDRGEARVTLPDWFEALNRNFRYQLTAIGAPGPNLHVASKISGNSFKIAGGTAGGEVSWQVTGVRQDAWANAHRIAVEQDKPTTERGFSVHPKEPGQPE